jgi:IclR family KDG regulon transcriptional repressor
VTEERSGDRPRIPTLRKMAELLQLFTPERPEWRMSELAREMGWSEPTTHRFLAAMVEIDMLSPRPSGAFGVGVLPVRLGAVYMSAEPRRQALLARTEQLAEQTGLTTQVGVLDGAAVSIVASREGSSAIKAAANLGERLPLHATAAGKAILSQLPGHGILPRRLERFTDATLTDRDELRAQVAAVAAGELARADSEWAPGLYALAVPVPAGWFEGHAAAVSCAGPSPALGTGEWELAAELLAGLRAELEAEAGRVGTGTGAA